MPTLNYKENGWNIIDLRYLTYYEKQAYISYFRSKEDFVRCECPQENVIKWRYRNGN